MPHPLLTVPANHRVGLTSISLGLLRALDRQGINVGFFKPVAQLRSGPRTKKSQEAERSTALVSATTALSPPVPLPAEEVERLLAAGREDELQGYIVSAFSELSAHEAVIVEGLVPTAEHPFATRVNQMIASALDAQVLLVADGNHTDTSLLDDLKIAANDFESKVAGCIINRAAPVRTLAHPSMATTLARAGAGDQHKKYLPALSAIEEAGFRVLGALPEVGDFAAYRMSDLAAQLGASVIVEGDWHSRRVRRTRICAMRIEHARMAFEHGTLIIVPADRDDILIGAALATLNGIQLAGILLTGSTAPSESLLSFCDQAFRTGLPMLHVKENTFEVAQLMSSINDEIPVGDHQRASLVMNTVANHISTAWVKEIAATQHAPRLSPAAFRHRLVEGARAANARIVLPEGTEPRIMRAAQVCADLKIARPVLLGEREQILTAATRAGIELGPDIEIASYAIPPDDYVDKMMELRSHKGINTRAKAIDALSDATTFGTMMMKLGHADGLVSGAVHSTAHTIRPALSLIKTRPGARLVSSVFFMCLPDQVLVFGDCAVNPAPDAEQLADIAIQSAESAAAFGIEARVAMISYSTGTSGTGSDVDKVREATRLAQKARPDLQIDGPLQYDAAINPGVALTKAPHSQVAGRATVLVFPDLNTGNTTYKAVQRSANVLSIGPMLQGLALPVNDLSRGATVDDIVYTVALTAVQAAARR